MSPHDAADRAAALELLEEWERIRQAEVDSGDADWAFLVSAGIAADPRTGEPL